MQGYDAPVPHKVQEQEGSDSVKEYFTELQRRRRSRLLDLIASAGGQTEAIERLKKSQAQLSQLSTGKKPIGEALARSLEQAAGKPFGWMDATEERPATKSSKTLPQDAYWRKLVAIWPKLTVADHRELYGRAAGFLQRSPDSDDAEVYRRA